MIVADQCGVAVGFDGGKGVRIDDFWRKSVNCESSEITLTAIHPNSTLCGIPHSTRSGEVRAELI